MHQRPRFDPRASVAESSEYSRLQKESTKRSSTHASSRAITRPRCPKCGTTMVLTRIVPHAPGDDLRTFECPTCEHVENEVVKFE